MTEDPFWIDSARQLAVLFSRMPDVDPLYLGADAQSFLKAYKPVSLLWDKDSDSSRERFVTLEPKTFNSIYQLYRSEIQKHRPRLGA